MKTQPDVGQAGFDAQLAALRRQFIAGLPARRSSLIGAWRECTDGGGEAAWQKLRDTAHNLAGSAPCYGFEGVGTAARGLDRLLSGAAPSREPAQVRAPVEQLLAALAAIEGDA